MAVERVKGLVDQVSQASDEQAAGFRSEASDRGYEVNLVGTYEVLATSGKGAVRSVGVGGRYSTRGA